jgi:hypothetical protein
MLNKINRSEVVPNLLSWVSSTVKRIAQRVYTWALFCEVVRKSAAALR